jgi:uridylate kinase
MKPKNHNAYIISLGGSLIVPDEIDTGFLKNFKNLIVSQVKRGKKFVIITGGGKIARNYSGAAKKLGDLNPDDLDWLGIHATRLNAHLIRTIFKKYARPRIITNPHSKEEFKNSSNYPIIVAAGYRPGVSTDFDAVVIAEQYGIHEILNLSNIDYVYNKDPNRFADAQPLANIIWKDFRKMVGDKWDPGLNTPFDPIAAKLAQKIGLKVAILNGKKILNIKNYLEDKKYKGTVIQ